MTTTTPIAPDPVLAVVQTCGAIGDLEHYAATQVRAGKLSKMQKVKIKNAQLAARRFCINPQATADDPGSAAQLRALVPLLSSIIAGKK